MYIEEIDLYRFRNYESVHVQVHPKVNLILGDNAQGKTNLLESVYICSLGRSFRTAKSQDMIMFGEEYGRVRVEGKRDGMDTSVELILTRDGKKSAKVDGVRIYKASALLNHLYMVIFSPEDLKIVKDEPEKRRRFIDRELCQLRPKYYEDLAAYKKVLTQRNAYLKESMVDPSVLDIWDMQLAKYGASIMHMRKAFIEKLDGISRDIHRTITGNKEELQLVYAPNIPLAADRREQEEAFYALLGKMADSDLKQRTTTRGPHKDDMEFLIGGIGVRSFGSQGQQRTCALSVKLAELRLIREETGEDAILLLDDVMSELDYSRQEYLVKALSDIQMFITTTEVPETLKKILLQGKVFYVEKGTIREEKNDDNHHEKG